MNGSDVSVSGGAIRLLHTGPVVLDGPSHHAAGITSVEINSSGDLEIRHDPGGVIISITAAIDETLALRGILAGASGGAGRTVVRLYSTKTGGHVRADGPEATGWASNLWMTWLARPAGVGE